MRPRSMSVIAERPLALVSPGGSPAPRNPADLPCFAAGESVSSCAGVSEFFGLFPDGTQSCGKDHVQERSFSDSLDHNDASKVRKRIALRGLRSETLQIGKIALSERQALAGLGWLVESSGHRLPPLTSAARYVHNYTALCAALCAALAMALLGSGGIYATPNRFSSSQATAQARGCAQFGLLLRRRRLGREIRPLLAYLPPWDRGSRIQRRRRRRGHLPGLVPLWQARAGRSLDGACGGRARLRSL